MAQVRFTAEEIAAALIEARGLVTDAAKRLGCNPKTIERAIANYPTVSDARHEAREALKDLAESKLLQAINAGELTAIIFFLKCQAKDRGYVERQEVTGIDGGPLSITIDK